MKKMSYVQEATVLVLKIMVSPNFFLESEFRKADNGILAFGEQIFYENL